MLKLPDKSENQTCGLRFTVRRSRLFLSRPILRTPVLEVPFGAVVVAFVIDVIKPVDGQDEIGRIIIDIQMNGIQAGAHGLQLPEAEAGEPVFRDQLRCPVLIDHFTHAGKFDGYNIEFTASNTFVLRIIESDQSLKNLF